MMPSTEHLELILRAVVIAAAVVTTVVTFVGTMTYLVTRERPHPVPGAKAATVREPAPARMPAAVAG
jgi:hypothetical protein